MEHRFLENSREIRESIFDLLSGEGEKYAVVGFVGGNAIEYLPNSKKMTVICWPKAGATNPEGVRVLLNSGFDVKFCDNLHSKIFWCESKGVIISSSNLSDNALGDSGLIEYGVFIKDDEYDFHQSVLNNIKGKWRDVTDEELDRLDIDTNKFNRRNDIWADCLSNDQRYSDWYERGCKQKWKIIWYSEELKLDDETKNEVYEKFGATKWKNFNDIDSGIFQEGDVVFQFKMDEDEEYIPRANGKWFYVDMVASTNKIIQIDDIAGVSIPFKVDPIFKKSFKKAFFELGWDKILDNKYHPKKPFLELIYKLYQKNPNK